MRLEVDVVSHCEKCGEELEYERLELCFDCWSETNFPTMRGFPLHD